MSQTTPASAANERDLFQRTMIEHKYCQQSEFVRDQYGYVDEVANAAWLSWQAARAIPQPAAEPVAMSVFERFLSEARECQMIDLGEYLELQRLALSYTAPDRAPSADSAAPKLPSTPEAVMAMFRCHYSQQITHTEEGAPLDPEDVAFTLTVHDILSAFDDWQDGEASADSAADTRAAFDVFMATPEAEFYNATHETAWIIWQGASRGSAADGWQPIETAPLDKSILLWWRPIKANKYAECAVIGQISSYEPGTWWNGQRGKSQDIWHVTGWRPLPAAPAIAAMPKEAM